MVTRTVAVLKKIRGSECPINSMFLEVSFYFKVVPQMMENLPVYITLFVTSS